MKAETARSYIEKKIQQSTSESFDFEAKLFAEYSNISHAELARRAAKKGLRFIAASHLNRDTSLTARQKGLILAETHTIYAKRTEYYGKRDSQRIALNLTRAANRA